MDSKINLMGPVPIITAAMRDYVIFCVAFCAINTILVLSAIAIRDRITTEAPWLLWLTINLTLAWTPLLLSSFAISNRTVLMLIIPLWIAFLPNAPYLITDLIYLRTHSTWLDIIILITVAALGLSIGALSLHQMADALYRFWQISTHITYPLMSIIVGIGVYLGRIMRWNSWDIITNPRMLIADIFNLIRNPDLNIFGTTIAFGIIFFAAACIERTLFILVKR